MEKIIITTGGTGGHIFPAIAVGEELKKRYPDIKILFMGGDYGAEKKLAQEAGLEFVALPERGLLGKGLKAVPAAFGMLISIIKALKIIRDFKPQCVAAFGGYACFAPVIAAKLLNIPYLLHEQNAVAGQANKIIARWADRICISLPNTKGFENFIGKITLTGNPVRKAIKKVAYNSGKKKLLVIGGSQGAHALNQFIVQILPELKRNEIKILHQTGKKDYEETRAAYIKMGFPEDWVKPFINDMPNAYKNADLAFCRAGASTASELCAVGLPSILVPFPAAIHDHQTLNAKILRDVGAALLIPEKKLDKNETAKLICDLINDEKELNKMSCAAKSLSAKDAACEIVNELENII